MRTINLLLLLAALGALGCGDDGDDGNGGSSGNGGSTEDGAGGSATTGTTSTSSTTSTTGTTGTTGTTSTTSTTSTSGGETCEPGYTAGVATLYPFPFDNCGQIVGLEHLDDVSFRDLTLPSPVGPGQTYAFSAEMHSAPGTWEVYGATEKCGAAGELLDTIEVAANGVVCHEVAPTTETYSHLIWVWYVGGSQGDTTFCEGGRCTGR